MISKEFKQNVVFYSFKLNLKIFAIKIVLSQPNLSVSIKYFLIIIYKCFPK